MFAYALKRIGLGFLVLILAISSLYVLILAAPGDPASAMLGPRATPALRAAITEKLGLDRPMPVQVFNYLISVLQGRPWDRPQKQTTSAEYIENPCSKNP